MLNPHVFKPAFLLSLITILIGALLKILHLPGGQLFILVGILLTLMWMVSGLYEIYGSNRITIYEKIMWTIGFISLSTVAGLLYFFIGRPRILRAYKILSIN
ncbi:MAG: hypothetical protein H7Y13_16550 [Sphingobacteriaceae bacterium]|nr:hypothetical protein [Sphingobacteriaceae bacterium]